MKKLLKEFMLLHDADDLMDDAIDSIDMDSIKTEEPNEEQEVETVEEETIVEDADGDELKVNEEPKGKVIETNWAAARDALAKTKEENKSLAEKVKQLEELVTSKQDQEEGGDPQNIEDIVRRAIQAERLEGQKETLKVEANNSLNSMMKDLKLSTKDIETFMMDVKNDYGVDVFKNPKRIDDFKNVYFSKKIIETERQKILAEMKNPNKTGKVKVQETSTKSKDGKVVDQDMVNSVAEELLKDM